MSRIEITDEMVLRFYHAYKKNGWPVFYSVAPRIRQGLEAALNQPDEPDIVVTSDMEKAAQEQAELGCSWAEIYRAMRRVAPDCTLPQEKPRRRFEDIVVANVVTHPLRHWHRRKGDK